MSRPEVDEFTSEDWGFRLQTDKSGVALFDAPVDFAGAVASRPLQLLDVGVPKKVYAASNGHAVGVGRLADLDSRDAAKSGFCAVAFPGTVAVSFDASNDHLYVLAQTGIHRAAVEDVLSGQPEPFTSVKPGHMTSFAMSPAANNAYAYLENAKLHIVCGDNSSQLDGVKAFTWIADATKIAAVSESALTIYTTDGNEVKSLEVEDGGSLISVSAVDDNTYYVVGAAEDSPDVTHLLINLPAGTVEEIFLAPPFGSVDRCPTVYASSIRNWRQNTAFSFLSFSLTTEIATLECGANTRIVSPSNDTDRAELPMNDDGDDTLPVGLALDFTGTDRKVVSPCPAIEEAVGVLPRLLCLNSMGCLLVWDVFDIRGVREGALSLQRAVESVASLKQSTSNVVVPEAVAIESSERVTETAKNNTMATEAPPASDPGSSQTDDITSSFGSSGFGISKTSADSPFGASQPKQSTGFGQSGFGVSKTEAPASSGFGASGFGSSGFGNTAAPKPAFGSTGFGASSDKPASSSGFGKASSASPAFGSTGFGSNSDAKLSFGGTGFGDSAKTASTALSGNSESKPAFGSTGFGASSESKPAFGSTGFGASSESKPAFGSTSFGASSESKPAFGSTGFGSASKPAFGSSSFGENSAKPAFGGSGFGSAPSTKPAFGGSGFGDSSAKPAFGSTGFGTDKSTRSFGAKPFGGSQKEGNSPFGNLSTPTQSSPFAKFGEGSQTKDSPFGGLQSNKTASIFDTATSSPFGSSAKSESSGFPSSKKEDSNASPFASLKKEDSGASPFASLMKSEAKESVFSSSATPAEDSPSGDVSETSSDAESITEDVQVQIPDSLSEGAEQDSQSDQESESDGEEEQSENEIPRSGKTTVDEDSSTTTFAANAESTELLNEPVDKVEHKIEETKSEETKNELNAEREVEEPKPEKPAFDFSFGKKDEEPVSGLFSPALAKVDTSPKEPTKPGLFSQKADVNVQPKAASSSLFEKPKTPAFSLGSSETNKSTDISSKPFGTPAKDTISSEAAPAVPREETGVPEVPRISQLLEKMELGKFDGFTEAPTQPKEEVARRVHELVNNTHGVLEVLSQNAEKVSGLVDSAEVHRKTLTRDDLQNAADWSLGDLDNLSKLTEDPRNQLLPVAKHRKELNTKLEGIVSELDVLNARKLKLETLLAQLASFSSHLESGELAKRPLDIQGESLRQKLRQKTAYVQSLSEEIAKKLIPLRIRVDSKTGGMSQIEKLERVVFEVNMKARTYARQTAAFEEEAARLAQDLHSMKLIEPANAPGGSAAAKVQAARRFVGPRRHISATLI